ncbi:MAG: sigma-E processing peptidase SpoIIGA [Candidatus Scatovivens sp.]
MTLYIDLILLENIVMNYIILVATSIISKSKISLIRSLISASIGSIYSILNYLVQLSTLSNLILKIFISILMIRIVFGYKKIKTFFKQLIMFYLTSFTFGGVTFMLLFFINPENVVFNGNHLVGIYPIKVTIIGGIVGFIIISIVAIIVRSRINQNNIIYDLKIVHKGKQINIKTLIDSGNLLKDPITNMDVIIVEKNSLKELLEKEAFEYIENMLNGNLLEENFENIQKYKFKLIPFSSLGNENGMLVGFRPEYIIIYGEEENTRKDVIIGIYDGKLTKTNKYTSLVGLNIFKRSGDINENFKKSKV